MGGGVKTPPTWELRSLYDGRYGIYYDGICRGVVYSREEGQTWFDLRRTPTTDIDSQNAALNRVFS